MKRIALGFLIASVLLLSACVNQQTFFSPRSFYLNKTEKVGILGAAGGAAVGAYTGGGVGAGVGALLGGIVGTTVGHFLQQKQTLLQKIESHGVKVVAVGDNVLLILPTNKFFYPQSPNPIASSTPVLSNIAKLLHGYNKVIVKVAAYTDNTCSAQRALALTQQQAQKVVDYLWASGTDTRIMYAKGYGSSHYIASNKTAYGRALNRRIEITLRLLPKCCQLGMGTG